MGSKGAKLSPPVIEIADDDSSSDEEIQTDLQRDAVAMLQSILPHIAKHQAINLLSSKGWNVEKAVNLALEASVVDKHPFKSSPKRSLDFKTEGPARKRKSLTTTKTSTEHRYRETILSEQWHACVARTQQAAPGMHFVDSDFPPTAKSLDGRMRQSNAQKPAAIKCFCGLPAAAKRVQSDGPNYGRFYLACGQQQRRRARVVVVKNNHNETKVEEKKEQFENETAPVVHNPYAKKKEKQSTPTTPSKKSSITSYPPSPQKRNCSFFQWDKTGSLGISTAEEAGYNSSRYGNIQWHHFGLEQDCFLFRKSFDTSQVRQGAVGNCWFLSALAVVAEKPYLIEKIVPHDSLNDIGCYQINLFLDGQWQSVIVDSYLPVILEPMDGMTIKRKGERERRKGGVLVDAKKVLGSPSEIKVAIPAFCAAPDRQIWAPLVEKAYAKAHGSYQQLSGGFIQEGLQDLTGAPSETIVFQAGLFDRDTFWARLLSFHSAGFLMGVATAQGGEGLVGSHAYSVLDVLEVTNCVIGEQLKVTDFFQSQKSPDVTLVDKDGAPIKKSVRHGERTTVRLVRIRNPWGKREWTGEWSAESERWTKALRQQLGSESTYAKDGTFYMSYDDMLQRFHHMDVSKTREDWVNASTDGTINGESDPISSSQFVYVLRVSRPTQVFISAIQPKKRANTKSKHWYCDLSLILLKRQRSDDWLCEASDFAGIKRQNCLEVFLEPEWEYICIPFSCAAILTGEKYFFRLVTYSSADVAITRDKMGDPGKLVRCLHKSLLARELKLTYSVSSEAQLVCVHGEGCLYFLALNGSSTHYLSLKIFVDLPDGLIAYKLSNDSYDLPPKSEKICLIVMSNGRRSNATELKFRYLASLTAVMHPHKFVSVTKLTSSVEICLISAAMTLSTTDLGGDSLSGGGTIDVYHWIPQLGLKP